MREKKRWCYWICRMQDEQHHAKRGVEGARGFVPSRVVENEPGHSYCSYPTPEDKLKLPWFWSEGFSNEAYEQAKQHAEAANADMGLTKKDVAQIVCSSMFHKDNDKLK